MLKLSHTVLLCIAIELTVVWVLRRRTGILRRTSLERLMYVAGLGTLVTQPFAWMFTHDLALRFGFVEMTLITQAIVILAEVGLYRVLGRIGWRKSTIFSVLTNSASLLILLGVYVSHMR